MADPIIWLLLDDRVSNRRQTLAVAQALGLPFEKKELRYNFCANLPNALLGSSWISLYTVNSSDLEAPWPDLVIATGRRSVPIARAIKRQKSACKLVHILWPDCDPKHFDLIVLPEHDAVPSQPNIITTVLPPSPLTRAYLDTLSPALNDLPKPRIALLMGGNSRHAQFTDADCARFSGQASALRQMLGGTLLITTSRRTPLSGITHLRGILKDGDQFHDVHTQKGRNPYEDYLAAADLLIVTGDSVSMLGEAVMTARPVYIFNPDSGIGEKIERFQKKLYAANLARPFAMPLDTNWKPAPVADATADIARAIRARLTQAA